MFVVRHVAQLLLHRSAVIRALSALHQWLDCVRASKSASALTPTQHLARVETACDESGGREAAGLAAVSASGTVPDTEHQKPGLFEASRSQAESQRSRERKTSTPMRAASRVTSRGAAVRAAQRKVYFLAVWTQACQAQCLDEMSTAATALWIERMTQRDEVAS